MLIENEDVCHKWDCGDSAQAGIYASLPGSSDSLDGRQLVNTYQSIVKELWLSPPQVFIFDMDFTPISVPKFYKE